MFIYTIGIFLYGFLLRFASLFNKKAKMWVQGRRSILDNIADAVQEKQRIIWVHCSSLGEFEQGRPLMEAIRERYPEFRIFLTFFSPSGYEIRKNYAGADYVFYLPLDTPGNARKFVEAVSPEITIFVKYEFWLNYLRVLRKTGRKTYLVSAIFRRNSAFFRWYGSIYRKALGTFRKIFVQDENSLTLLDELGYKKGVMAGDTRFDRVAQIAASAPDIELVREFAEGSKILIAGSTWEPDEELLFRIVESRPQMKFVIVPHEIEGKHIENIIAATPAKTLRYTRINRDTDFSGYRVLVVDVIGILSAIYRYADFTYIGGGFGVGIHNTLEAAVYGKPVAFGPNYAKFKEAADLIEAGAARSVGDSEELQVWLERLLADENLYRQVSMAASDYVSSHVGATEIILREILPGAQ